MTETEAFVILASLSGVGPTKVRKLVERFGSALEAVQAAPDTISTLPGFEAIAKQWGSWKHDTSWREEIALAEKNQIAVLPFTSPHYPQILLTTPDFPALIYAKGEILPQDTQRSIAIVGTRNASIYGLEMAERLSRSLASAGFTIISGLARGIDTAAHQGALTAGRTLAVIGSGLCHIYPPENRALAESIGKQGALISEFPLRTPPDRQNFPRRNRIVSGLSTGALLVEAPIKSGAMITMEKSLAYKKKLFAIPGRIDWENFRGNHTLIKSGKAHLIETADDLLSHYDNLISLPFSPPTNNATCSLDADEKKFLSMLPEQELNIDAIVTLSQIPIAQLNSLLMGLLLKKKIKSFPGQFYKVIKN